MVKGVVLEIEKIPNISELSIAKLLLEFYEWSKTPDGFTKINKRITTYCHGAIANYALKHLKKESVVFAEVCSQGLQGVDYSLHKISLLPISAEEFRKLSQPREKEETTWEYDLQRLVRWNSEDAVDDVVFFIKQNLQRIMSLMGRHTIQKQLLRINLEEKGRNGYHLSSEEENLRNL